MHIVVGAPTANGVRPRRRDYASFADPCGNTWVIQEIGYGPPHGG